MTVNELGFSTIITEGQAVFDLGQLRASGVSANALRKFLFIPAFPNYRRTLKVDQTGDGATIRYTIADVQESHGYGVVQKLKVIQVSSNSREGLAAAAGARAKKQARRPEARRARQRRRRVKPRTA